MARVLSMLSLFGAASAAPAILLQTDGVSAGVAAQVKMVQKIISQLQSQHRQVTEGEQATLKLVEDTLRETTLVNIQFAHDDDVKLLGGAVQSIKDCDADLEQTEGIDGAKATLDAARAGLVQCRAKEAELLAFQQEEQKKLDNFVAATAQGPSKDQSGLGCDLPSPSRLEDSPDGMGDFFKSSQAWYAGKLETVNTLVANNNKAIADHAAQKADCDDNYQPDFEAKYCAWSALVVEKRNNYAACRTSTEGALDKTFDDVTVKSGHRKADFTAVNRVRCLLKVLMLEGSADDVDAELNKCLDEVIETSQFTITKPAYPPTADGALAALGNLSGETQPLDSVECKA